MPELPEVETVVRQLRPSLVGNRLLGIELRDPKLYRSTSERIAAEKLSGVVTSVFRSGKLIVMEVKPSKVEIGGVISCFIAVHLRMTGRLLWNESGHGPKWDSSRSRDGAGGNGSQRRSEQGRAKFLFPDGSLVFADTRRFGTIEILSQPAKLAPAGVDPLSEEFTQERLDSFLCRSTQPIKSWLLRQDRLVGIGNIYASEILFAAKIHPRRRACSLARVERVRLYRATKQILLRAIRFCGTTFSDFQHTSGASGSFQKYLTVYGREKLPCKQCRRPVRRIVQQQRSTFFCPNCQPARPGAISRGYYLRRAKRK